MRLCMAPSAKPFLRSLVEIARLNDESPAAGKIMAEYRPIARIYENDSCEGIEPFFDKTAHPFRHVGDRRSCRDDAGWRQTLQSGGET